MITRTELLEWGRALMTDDPGKVIKTPPADEDAPDVSNDPVEEPHA